MNFSDLGILHQADKNEYLKVIEDCIDNSKFIMGDYIQLLENEICNILGAKYAIGVSSGTDALMISLMALGIGEGDEVITTPFTFIGTAEPIALLKARPVFCDIDQDTLNIDPKEIIKHITKKTRAIIPVHLYGNPSDMVKIMEISDYYKIPIIEDCAQSFGAELNKIKTSNFGICGALSFFPAKNLGCFGDGGMIISNTKDFYDKACMIRVHGQRERYVHEILGINGRLDTIQAAVLYIKCRKINEWINERIKLAEIYKRRLAGISCLKFPGIYDNSKNVYNQFTLIAENRDLLQKYLKENNIPTAIHYPVPLHLQPAFSYLNYKSGDFPVSEFCSTNVLSLPLYPGLDISQQDFIINHIDKFYK